MKREKLNESIVCGGECKICAHKRRAGEECDFCEFTINEPKDGILEKLYLSDYDMYGFSCYIWNIDRVLEICRNLKSLKPDCTIVLGGPEVSFDAEKLYENFKTIYDIVVKAKPSAVKGTYMNNLTITTTMGPSIKVDVNF